MEPLEVRAQHAEALRAAPPESIRHWRSFPPRGTTRVLSTLVIVVTVICIVLVRPAVPSSRTDAPRIIPRIAVPSPHGSGLSIDVPHPRKDRKIVVTKDPLAEFRPLPLVTQREQDLKKLVTSQPLARPQVVKAPTRPSTGRCGAKGLQSLVSSSVISNIRARGKLQGHTLVTEEDALLGLGEAAARRLEGSLEVVLVPCLSDNYAPILHDKATGATAVVDTPEAGPIVRALEQRGWKLTHILNTHHHHDHTGANLELKDRYGCEIIGSSAEAPLTPGIDRSVGEGDEVRVGNLVANVLEVGGHTRGHIAYHFPHEKALFTGDALFTLGCGRVFEGTPEQAWDSLQKLRQLPDDTIFYCAHEYTAANARFAKSVDPQNGDLLIRIQAINALREKQLPTVPSLLGHEKLTNPFLLADTPAMRDNCILPQAPGVEVFAALRRAKDHF